MENLTTLFCRAREYLKALFKWIFLGLVIGVFCGVIGSAFHIGVHEVTVVREKFPWVLCLMPAAGVLIVWIYRVCRVEGKGTDSVIDEVHLGRGLPFLLLPAIFIGTVVTHLFGGSAGREGAALQMGGTIGFHTGRFMKLDDRDMRVATLAGMAAFFSALFGTPLAATVFAMMVVSVGIFYDAAFIPCFTAALTAFAVAFRMGVEPTSFSLVMPEFDELMLAKVAVLAALCAVVAHIFCSVLHFTEHKMEHHFKNSYLRAAVGGLLVVGLTLLVGTTDYNGAGMEVITAAVEGGGANWEAFILKMVFTAVTLAAGFKGGEVVPSFFIGATFGCVIGPMIGIPAQAAAAIGLIAVFCGATNCPIASIFLAIELFGGAGLVYFGLACGVSYMLSGYNGLYSSQTVLYSKLKAQYINVHTNAYHAGDPHNEPPVHGSVED